MTLRRRVRAVPGARSAYNTALLLARRPLALRFLPRYLRERRQHIAAGGTAPWVGCRPHLSERGSHSFDGHYVHQSGWAMGQPAQCRPSRHVDVASPLPWVPAAAALTKVDFVDVRPLHAELPGVTVHTATILAMPFADRSAESVSCLHALEHIGLGMYGDALDPAGTAKAAAELARITDGRLIVSLPVGRPRTEFNGQRVHAPDAVPALFPGLELVEFSVVDDDGNLRQGVLPTDWIHLEYGCGLYAFERS